MSEKLDELAETFALDLCKLVARAYVGTGWKWGWLNGTVWVYRNTRHSTKSLKSAGRKGAEEPEALSHMLCSMRIEKGKIIVRGGSDYRMSVLKESILRKDSPVHTKRKNFKIIRDSKEWDTLFFVRRKKTYVKWIRISDEARAKGGSEKEMDAYMDRRIVEEFTKKEIREFDWEDLIIKEMGGGLGWHILALPLIWQNYHVGYIMGPHGRTVSPYYNEV